MGSYANKTQDKSRNTDNSAAKQQGGCNTLHLVNNRPEAVAQRQLQLAADNSAQVKQLKTIQQMADGASQKIAVNHPAPVRGQFVIQMRKPRDFGSDPDPNFDYDNEIDSSKGQRYDAVRRTKWDILDHTLLGATGSTAGAGKADGMIYKQKMTDGTIVLPREVSAFAGASGAIGAVADLRSGYKSGKEVRDKANSTATRAHAFGETVGSIGSATKGAATSTINFSEFAKAGFTGAATTTASVASVATGAADIVTGAYGGWKAGKRQKGLKELQKSNDADDSVKLAARIGAASQGREKIRGYSKALKGVAGVVGGAMILAGAATPFGWMALTIGAGIAAGAAAFNYYKKRKSRQEMAAAILGVEPGWKKWKPKRNEDKRDHPLAKQMLRQGYKDPGHVVNNYAWYMSSILHEDLMDMRKQPRESTVILLKNLGFNIDKDKRYKHRSITPAKIQRKLLL